MAEQKSLCERIGGEAAIKSVVDKFYVYMLDDPRVKEFFKDTDMDKQRQRQTSFITMAFGGPNNYTGLDMKTAHAKMAIGHLEFDATWENLVKSMNDHNVPADLQAEAKEIFYSVEEDCVTKP